MEKILQDISFIDEKEYIHKIDIANMIGSGAQGMVFRGENKNILIKISQVKKENDFGRKIDKIKSLNLSKDFKFALPITKLISSDKNYEGYIMRMMEDMRPIACLMRTSFENIEECYKYYNQETGGLRRRLEVLKKIAYNLYYLHSKGIVYGDISPNNIFVSKDKSYSEIWFIDCDNIDYAYDINYTRGTEGFCSPEIRKSLAPYNMAKEKNTIENDIYAFANLAFNILFLADPFKGSIVLEENETDEDNDDWWEVEDDDNTKFDLGEVSWVGENNGNNKPIYGLSINIDKMISPELKDLFDRTLGYIGRNNPKERPSLRLWYEEINNLLNSLTDNNDENFYYLKNKNSLNKDYLIFEINYQEGKKCKEIIKKKEEIIELKYCDLGIGEYGQKEEIYLKFNYKEDKKIIENNALKEIIVEQNHKLDGEEKIKIKSKNQKQVIKFEELIINMVEEKIKIKVMGGSYDI
jgi:serine threonine protein kinase